MNIVWSAFLVAGIMVEAVSTGACAICSLWHMQLKSRTRASLAQYCMLFRCHAPITQLHVNSCVHEYSHRASRVMLTSPWTSFQPQVTAWLNWPHAAHMEADAQHWSQVAISSKLNAVAHFWRVKLQSLWIITIPVNLGMLAVGPGVWRLLSAV